MENDWMENFHSEVGSHTCEIRFEYICLLKEKIKHLRNFMHRLNV